MKASTSFEIAGNEIIDTMTVVRGITVRTRSLPTSIVAGLATLFGGRSEIFTNLCDQARAEAFELMLDQAREMGADAVIGIRYDTGPMVGAAEVLCYGTAVKLRKS